MKRVVFGLATVTTICACGFVIDADKLVEGNATGAPTEAGGADTSTGTDGGSDTDTGATDAGTDAPPVFEVPECVPAKPNASAEGPYAVVTASGGFMPACPVGYLATPIAQGKGGFTAPLAQCNDPTGCSCGAATGTAKCGMRMRYFEDGACTEEADTGDSVGGFCAQLDDEDYLKLEATVSGVTCPPSGTATPTLKPPPVFGTTVYVCAPDPNVKTAQCKDGNVALPATKNADACVIVPANVSCSGNDYDSIRFYSKDGTFTDGRTCACSCSGDPATSCTGGAVNTFAMFVCSGTSTVLNVGACRSRGGDDSINVNTAPTASASPACTARATPGGEASPNNDLKLCCLGFGGSGGN